MLHKRNMMLKDNMIQAKELTKFIDTYIQMQDNEHAMIVEEAPAAAAPDAASSSTVESTA